MRRSIIFGSLPRYIWALTATYFVASLAHFVHNAEYIAFYPNMPSWITREHVYLVWVGITAIGALAMLLLRLRLYALGIAVVGMYGAFGLDGLAHYTLALCSEHTFVTNVTIWAEAISGLLLLLASAVLFSRGILGQRESAAT